MINIQGVDPVVDQSLVFFNFDNLGLWWNDAGNVQNDPALSSGRLQLLLCRTRTATAGRGFSGATAQNNFPGATIGTNVSDYVLKFDINVLEPITGGEFAWRLKGSAGDFWYYWKPWEVLRIVHDQRLDHRYHSSSSFYAGSTQISDLSTITEDFGVAFNNGASHVKACVDNVRFEHL